MALFDGATLKGWVNINCAPDTFGVRDGMIASTGVPICEIRTERMYENFVLELEWQHMKPMGNAGVFIWADALPARGQPFLRAIEVQVLDGRNSETYTSHGDVFAIHGAVLTPDRPHPNGCDAQPAERAPCEGARRVEPLPHHRQQGRAQAGRERQGGVGRLRHLAAQGLHRAGVGGRADAVPQHPDPRAADVAGTLAAGAGRHGRRGPQGAVRRQEPHGVAACLPIETPRWRTNDWTIALRSDHAGTRQAAASRRTAYGDVEVIADWRWVDEAEPAAAQAAARRVCTHAAWCTGRRDAPARRCGRRPRASGTVSSSASSAIG